MSMGADRPRFAIMGTGGVGGYFGGLLAKAGFDVHFIARGAHLAAMQANGLAIESISGDFHIDPVHATDDPSTIGTVDFVLFCVKLWDTESAGAACRPLLGPKTAVVSLQNGVESETVLAGLLGENHIIGGVAEIAASIRAPGIVKHVSPFQQIRFGELDNRASARVERLDAALTAAGIVHVISPDIRLALWEKFVFLVGMSALTALTRQTIGPVRDNPDTRSLLVQVMEETAAVARAKGAAVEADFVGKRLDAIDGFPPEVRASMALDLQQGRPLELPWLSGTVARFGDDLGVSTPANHFINAALTLHADGAG